jgi:WD40 repeat protein
MRYWTRGCLFIWLCIVLLLPVGWVEAQGDFRGLLRLGEGELLSAAWRSDGQRLAVSSRWGIQLYDGNFKRIVSSFEASYGIRHLAWQPGGNLLAGVKPDNSIIIWREGTPLPLKTLVGHRDQVNALAWSADGRKLATASADKTVRIWDVLSGQLLQTTERSRPILAVAWDPKDERVVFSVDNLSILTQGMGIYFWEYPTNKLTTLPETGKSEQRFFCVAGVES